MAIRKFIEDRLPAGVTIQPLLTNTDSRGQLIEIYRQSWLPSQEVMSIQWNYVRSHAGAMRGVHLHIQHADYLILLEGKMLLGLRDGRKGSPTENMSTLLELIPDKPQGILIPPGVLHGFYFPVKSVHIYGVSNYFNLADEYECRYDDPDLEIPWNIEYIILSERDQYAPSFKTLMRSIPPIEYKDLGN